MFTQHLAGVVFCLTGAVCAQSTKAEIFGLVRDPAGLPAPGAQVDLTGVATGVKTSAASNAQGEFHFFALPAGEYRISVSKEGFTTLRRGGVILRVGDQVSLDLALELGDVSELVEVTAQAPLLQASRGAASFVVEQKKIVTLPLDGRNYVPLIALSPGVSLPPGSLLPRINGGRPRVSEYIYDGISVLQPEPGQVAYYPVVDAIEEFRVETNSYSAEYGRANGGVIMVNQKSGSNELHGTLFEFFRNEALNARNLFAPANAPKPRFRRNQNGFTLGGPIERNKTFFFGDWQGTRLQNGVVRTSTVPAANQKRGIFTTPIYDPQSGRQTPFPGNEIPVTRFDSAALAVLARYPDPTGGTAANNYTRVGNDRNAQDQFDGRLDRYFGGGQRVFGRYSFLRDEAIPTSPFPDGSGNITAGVIGKTLTRADSVVLEHSWMLSPEAVNQLRFGYTRRKFDRTALNLPIYNVVGFQQLGPPPNGIANFGTSVTQFIDNFTRIRGRHSVKFGADIRLEHLDVLQPPIPTGQFQFTNIFTAGLTATGTPLPNTGNSFASFLTGQVSLYNVDVQPEMLRPRAAVAEFFVQDDFRATRRLSVNLGLRYTLNFPSTVVGDRGAVFNLNTQKLDLLGQNGYPRTARDLDKTNFGPRAGLAYRVSDSFVLRAGYGLTWIEQAGITTPFTTPLFPFVQNLTQQSLDNIKPAFVLAAGPSVTSQPPNPDAGLGQGVFAVQRDNGGGYAQQWNITLQKTFGENWSFEAGYLGSKLTRLGVPDVNLNQVPLDQLARGQLMRAYPKFTTVTLYRNNTGHSTYHSFQSRLEKRFSRGLTLSAAYTFSRLIDDAGQVFDAAILTGPVTSYQAADSFNKHLEKDVSTGNVPHIFSAGFAYELPVGKGWQIAGIARRQSGSPIAVTQATNFNAFAGFGIQRPNRATDPTLAADQRNVRRWFNTNAFSAVGQGAIGNSSRNPVVGPGYGALDLMVGKTFALAERLRAEIRMEAFNLTNTPTLGNPNGSFGAAAFGTITTALDPRVFEGVVKLQF